MATPGKQLETLVDLFVAIATADPVSPVLLVAGGATISVAIGIVAILLSGAVLEILGSAID